MTVLVISDDALRREALTRAATTILGGVAAAACGPAEVMLAVRTHRPRAAIVEAPSLGALVTLVDRLRGAAEGPLPVVAVLPAGAAAVAFAGGGEVPALAICAAADPPERIAACLHELGDGVPADAAPPFSYDPRARLLRGRGDAVPLTPLEARAFDLLLEAAGAAVSHGDLCAALWGRGERAIPVDGALRAALRTHLHGLRRKLRRVEAPVAIETHRNVGYALRVGAPPGAGVPSDAGR